MTNSTDARRPRRWWKALLVLLVLMLGTLAGLPWLVGSELGRPRIVARLNRALAPGRLEVRTLEVSWFGPTRLGGFVLKDPKGATVATGTAARFDRTLGQWIAGASGPLTLTIDGAALDVERDEDGSIDLAQALRTILASKDPSRDLAVKIAGGSFRYRDPFLAEPATADALDLDLRIRPAPDPVTWRVRLAKGEDASLEVHGDLDRWLSKGGPPRLPELQVSVLGHRWPFVAKAAGLDASGQLDGSLDFLRRRGHWRLSGESRLLDLRTKGSSLAGDVLALDRVEAGWDLAEGDQGWTIRRLSMNSSLGDLKAEGQLTGPSASGHQTIEGRLDLAAIARQLPRALHLRDGLTVERGSARLNIDTRIDPAQATFEVDARLADLAARDGDRALSLRDPAILTGRLVRRGDDARLERLAVKTSFMDVSAEGRLEEGARLTGTIDLAKLRDQLGEWVDLGVLDLAGLAEVSGTYRLREPTGPAPRFENRIEAKLRDLRLVGAGLGPIRRDRATLIASASGPAEPSGLPKSWEGIDLSVRSDKDAASLDLRRRGGPIRVAGSSRTTIDPPGGEQVIEARWQGDLAADGRGLGLNELTLALAASEERPGEARVLTAARGRWEETRGELVLESIPGRTGGVIVLGPDGLRISGIGRGLDAIRVEGGFSGESSDLDPILSGLFGRPPLGVSGRWSALASARGDADGLQFAGRIGLDEGSLARTPTRPTSMAARAHYSTGLDRLDLSEFSISTPFGTLEASGHVDNPAGARRVDLKGMLAPDFGAITARLASRVEPGAKIEGKPRSFRASGSLGGGSGGKFAELDAEVGFELDGADIYGMRFGPSPVVLRSKGGKLSVDPISATLNEGHVRLEPEIDLDAPGGPILRLAKNSTIREARINDEVSRRVLAYVAPILDQATRARGLVSVDLDHAEFPIGPGRGRQVKVEGAVVFEDVEFAPGPLANDVLSAIGRRDASLKLDRPVTLTIADGRINQRGMSVPIGDLTRIEMSGWVDFDRNLALTASLPVTPAMLGNNELLSDIAAGTTVRLPITGTLDRPEIDRQALADNLRDMGKSLLTRGATRGAMELLMRLARPRDPDAPPPPPRLTPQERKTLRQEKKAFRRGEVPSPPAPNPDR